MLYDRDMNFTTVSTCMCPSKPFRNNKGCCSSSPSELHCPPLWYMICILLQIESISPWFACTKIDSGYQAISEKMYLIKGHLTINLVN